MASRQRILWEIETAAREYWTCAEFIHLTITGGATWRSPSSAARDISDTGSRMHLLHDRGVMLHILLEATD